MPITRKSVRGADFSGSCKSEIHNGLVKGDEVVTVHKKSSRRHDQNQLEWLIDHGLFPKRGQYVCDKCLNYAKTNLERGKDAEAEKQRHDNTDSDSENRGENQTEPEERNDNEQTETEINDTNGKKVKEVIKLLQAGSLTDDEVNDLCYAVGAHLSGLIYEDSEKIAKQYRDITASGNVECDKFLDDRPTSIINLLTGIMTRESRDIGLTKLKNKNPKKIYALCLLIEQLCFVRNANFIGPFSFSQSLFKWTIHGSKVTQTLEGATTAAGSVKTLKGRFQNASKKENTCFESGDVEVWADNVQRVGKTTRVRESGTTPVGVATNVVFIQSNPSTTYQEQEELKPSEWFGNTPSADLREKIDDVEKDLKCSTFRPFRIQQQQKFLSIVAAETKVHNSKVEDHVSVRVSVNRAHKKQKVCPKCAVAFEFQKHSNRDRPCCPSCKHQIHDIPDREVLYGDIPSLHPPMPCSVHMGEIVDLNPNSVNTIKELLVNIAKQGEVGTKRKWVRVGFDGVPYNIASSIIDNTVVCNVCCAHIDTSRTPFTMHVETEHPGQTDIGHKKLFDYVLLTPGAGHIEINLLRAIFKLCRYVCLEKIAYLLGFRSKGSTEFICRGSNHHVTWQVFYIMFQAFAMELAHEYDVECCRTGRMPSQRDWRTWRETEVENPNYHFYYDLVFYYFLGLFCFRVGVRRNNSKFMLAGRQQVAPIMYIGKHRIYRKLIHRDMQTRVEAPAEIQSYIESTEAFSRSGDATRGEGGDYVTEGENRALKSNLPPGIPTLQNWQWASRCNQQLQQNRLNVFRRSGVTDTGNEKPPLFNFQEEVQCLRAEIRESGILSAPMEPKPLMSLDGNALHPELVNMHLTLTSNYDKYKESQNVSLDPLFVTQQDEREYNDIQTWTKEKISTRTKELITDFADEDLATFYAQQLQRTVSGTKKTLIDFYQEVKQAVETEKSEDVHEELDNFETQEM